MTMGRPDRCHEKSGVIQQLGTPEEVYEAPVNLFVASFIGSPSMNFMPVTLEGEQLRLAGGGSLPLDSGLSTRGQRA